VAGVGDGPHDEAHAPADKRATLEPQARQDWSVATGPTEARPALICFDGSDDAAAAIAKAGEMLAPRMAVVLTVWEPVRSWAASDPATILSAPLSRLVSNELGLDETIRDLARERMERGIELATQAGFQAEGRLEEGKPWRVICQSADALGAEPIVLGARGLGRVESALLGSVSTAVVFHTKRPVLVVPHNEDDRPSETPTE
jgi:nucleotide-binding universal stress UspA family protein